MRKYQENKYQIETHMLSLDLRLSISDPSSGTDIFLTFYFTKALRLSRLALTSSSGLALCIPL